ncbi:endolytic transglycosylase MltG [Rarobacter faecitabidus]|uniref:Endolytic murein transglycosylase n=1 Tax=Rarobacter faecitabidus TaxID=13243 RepID=A0A542ZWA1_RARFA|nr:endolytic transglycosylase MltG [Rarobacter faecitabidus]TQL64470.1 UPF0755 protein [Rarobacter faecitabidus]
MNHPTNDLHDLFSAEHPPAPGEEAPHVTTQEYTRRSALRAERRRKAARRRRTMIAILVTVVVVGVGGFVVSSLAGNMFSGLLSSGDKSSKVSDYPGPGSGEVEVSINPGDTGEDIATALRDADVIATRGAYLDVAAGNPGAQSIQPGTYALKTQMRAEDALSTLLNPNNRLDYVITIPEGWTFEQISTKVQSVLGVTPEDISEALSDPSATGLPKAAGGSFEGWLAPGQYVYARDVAIGDVFAEMVARRVKELDDLGVKKSERQDVLIKASILQREGTPAYYNKIARVIENRLKVGQALQMDTTVGYGAGKDVMTLTKADFQDTSNKYNTYVHTGLTPTPITNPSMDAIEATLKPEAGDWMYFVTVNLSTGETKFAVTFNEAQEYVAEYRAWKEENYTPTGESDQ